jgi:hypothetical protein
MDIFRLTRWGGRSRTEGGGWIYYDLQGGEEEAGLREEEYEYIQTYKVRRKNQD